MRPRSMAALGVVAYFLFVAAQVPASFVAERALASTGGVVQLTGPEGTLWNGTARGTISPPRSPAMPLDRVAWRFLPSRLLAGDIAFAMHAGAGSLAAHFEAARGFSGWSLREVRASAEASALANFAPIPASWRLTGKLTLTAPRLDWDGRQLEGEAALEWRNAATALTEVTPLGSYKAQGQASRGPAKFTLATLEGPLAIQGEGQFVAPADLTFTGQARPDAAQAKALEPLLVLLGPKRPDGAHALEWRSR